MLNHLVRPILPSAAVRPTLKRKLAPHLGTLVPRPVKVLTRVLSVTTGIALVMGLALAQQPVANAVSTSTKSKFISSLVSVAQSTQRKFGVPASVLIAQAIEASSWGTSSVASKAKNYFDTRCSATMTASQFAKLADAQVGKPYVLGAETLVSQPSPSKFDCSELVQWLFGRSGNSITDLAASQYKVTKKVTGSPRVGDLVFLRNNPARSNGIGHVAILTKKLSHGDWRIIEARGRADGVVRSTLSYWKKRSYYAGLRRLTSFALSNGDSVRASGAGIYKSGCLKIGSTSYSKFSSKTNSFYGNAAAITSDSAYASARKVMASIPRFVDAIAKVVRPKDPSGYARTLKGLISTYKLTGYDVVTIKRVLVSGDSGYRVAALQYLLKAAGYSTSITKKYDSSTRSAVKKFQKARKLDPDGQAGARTLSALFSKLSAGTSGSRSSALNALLVGLGYRTTSGSGFGSATVSSLKSLPGRRRPQRKGQCRLQHLGCAVHGAGHHPAEDHRSRKGRADRHGRRRFVGPRLGEPLLPVVPRQDGDQWRSQHALRRPGRRRRREAVGHGDRPADRLHPDRTHLRNNGNGRHRELPEGPRPHDQRHSQGRQDTEGQRRYLEPVRGDTDLPVVPRLDKDQGCYHVHLQAHQGEQGPQDDGEGHRKEERLHDPFEDVAGDPTGHDALRAGGSGAALVGIASGSIVSPRSATLSRFHAAAASSMPATRLAA